MTKVTVEMLERVDAVIAHAEQCAEPDGETAADLRALVELCRRVIEPEEDVVEKCARAGLSAEAGERAADHAFTFHTGIKTEALAFARAVLAAIGEG